MGLVEKRKNQKPKILVSTISMVRDAVKKLFVIRDIKENGINWDILYMLTKATLHKS